MKQFFAWISGLLTLIFFVSCAATPQATSDPEKQTIPEGQATDSATDTEDWFTETADTFRECDYVLSPAVPPVFSWDESPDAAMTEELKKEILLARGATFIDPYTFDEVYQIDYYGGFRGYHALKLHGFPTVDGAPDSATEVEGLSFAWDLTIYGRGEFHSVKAAYEAGILTKEDFFVIYRNFQCAKIYNSHGQYQVYPAPTVWENQEGEPVNGLDFFRYYGSCGSVDFYRIDDPEGDRVLSVGGEIFQSDEPFRILAFDGTSFTSLEQAAQSGILSAADLAVLAYYHKTWPEADLATGKDPQFSYTLLTEAGAAAGTSFIESDYYGTYGGYAVLEAKGKGGERDFCAAEDTVLRGLRDLIAFRDGAALPLEAVLDQGGISPAELKQIASLHQARHPDYYVRLPSSPRNLKASAAAKIEASGLPRGRLYPEDFCYESFEGYVFFLRYERGMYPWMIRVGGKDFRCPFYFTVYGYKNGSLTSLSNLWKDGKISAETLENLEALHREAFEDCYDLSPTSLPPLPSPVPQAVKTLAEQGIYYGSFDGWEIYCLPTEEYGITYSLNHYTLLYYGTRAHLYGYRDGQLMRLAKADREELISEQAAKEISEFHNAAYFDYVVSHCDDAYGTFLLE